MSVQTLDILSLTNKMYKLSSEGASPLNPSTREPSSHSSLERVCTELDRVYLCFSLELNVCGSRVYLLLHQSWHCIIFQDFNEKGRNALREVLFEQPMTEREESRKIYIYVEAGALL